jgi:IS5 family transposase
VHVRTCFACVWSRYWINATRLYRLAGKIDWDLAEARFGGLYAEEGRPGIPIRLMVGLHYLKHTFNESDESVVARWVENSCWQYFCGEE